MNFSPRQEFGAKFERWAAGELAGRGYPARLIGDWTAAADLVIDRFAVPILVEVKVSRPTWCPRGSGRRPSLRWQFDTARLSQVDHVVILVCLDQAGRPWPYIVPSWLLWDKAHAAITTEPGRYRGRLAGFLDNWSVIDQVAAQRQRHVPAGQLSLWGGLA